MNKLQSQNLKLSFISAMSLTKSYRGFRIASGPQCEIICNGNIAKGDSIYSSNGLQHFVYMPHTSCLSLPITSGLFGSEAFGHAQHISHFMTPCVVSIVSHENSSNHFGWNTRLRFFASYSLLYSTPFIFRFVVTGVSQDFVTNLSINYKQSYLEL